MTTEHAGPGESREPWPTRAERAQLLRWEVRRRAVAERMPPLPCGCQDPERHTAHCRKSGR